MDFNKNKKVLFLTDMEAGLEPHLQQETNVLPENMLIIQSYGPNIAHPYGDIMRSIIITLCQENVEEIVVVGTKDKKNISDDIQNLLSPEMKDNLETVDYLFKKNCTPEFFGDNVNKWLNGIEDVAESVKKSVDIIRHHPLVPSNVKVYGLMVNNKKEFSTVV